MVGSSWKLLSFYPFKELLKNGNRNQGNESKNEGMGNAIFSDAGCQSILVLFNYYLIYQLIIRDIRYIGQYISFTVIGLFMLVLHINKKW